MRTSAQQILVVRAFNKDIVIVLLLL